MPPMSTDCVRFVLALCDHPTQEDVPERLVDASPVVAPERAGAVAGEVRGLLDRQLLAADGDGRLAPTLDGLWHALHRARELQVPVPSGLLMGLGRLATPVAA